MFLALANLFLTEEADEINQRKLSRTVYLFLLILPDSHFKKGSKVLGDL